MSDAPIKLATARACRVARIKPEHLNEAISEGVFTCAPATVPGRQRYFDPHDMLSLWLYRELLEDGMRKAAAGRIACAVAQAARENPEARAIAYAQDYFGREGASEGDGPFNGGRAFPADDVPAHGEWDTTRFSGTDIRKVTTFRIGKMRELIAHYTTEELAYVD
jgi:hypothetical protein